MKVWIVLGILIALAACDSPTPEISEEITRQFRSKGRTMVNLAKVVPGTWDTVCILGPYSTSQHVFDTLGFAWPIETKSSISTSDGITLLLFVKNKKVIELVEHPRLDADFANLSRQCFAREQATFHHQTNPKKGWPGLFPKK